MDKGKIQAMVTKFSGKFAIIMLKKHRKFCRCGLAHLDATPTFKNCPNTYDAPCTRQDKKKVQIRNPNPKSSCTKIQPSTVQLHYIVEKGSCFGSYDCHYNFLP